MNSDMTSVLSERGSIFTGLDGGSQTTPGDFPHALGKPLARNLQRLVPRGRIYPYQIPHSAAADFNRGVAVENAAEGKDFFNLRVTERFAALPRRKHGPSNSDTSANDTGRPMTP